MNRDDIEKLWLSLTVDLKTSNQSGQIRRRLDNKRDVTSLVATNEAGIDRIGIIFGSIGDADTIRGSIPSCQNLSIWLAPGEAPELIITLTNSAYRKVFSALTAYLLEQTAARPDNASLGATLVTHLNEWKHFLENLSPEGLSLELQKGLFGELLFLGQDLLSRMDKRDAVSSWLGADRKSKDFSFNNGGVEIKTTTTKKHYKIEISNEQQLDPKDLRFLFLIHYNLQEDGRNRISLKDQVKNIRETLSENNEALHLFEIKLRNYGYLDAHDSQYETGYRIADKSVYIVNEQFPKIVTDDLPPGVGDLKYSVIISSCGQCLRNENNAFAEMGIQ